ncbi:MAG: exosortase [Acidobacteria bacterium]|nr:MAG: exosortase [Acidobacteriota bacterium]
MAPLLRARFWTTPVPEPTTYLQDIALDSSGGDTSARHTWLLQGFFLLVLIGFLYHSILTKLVLNWLNNPDFSHGFIIPIFSFFVVWQKRKKLAKLPLAPNWLGLFVIMGALMVLIVGVLGAELFLSRSSLVLLLAGIIIYFAGWRYFRALLFPWAVLFLMIPVPVIVFNEIAFPLQFLASRLATSFLGILGVPVLREGNVIQLPVMSLEVVEACSGIRSLVSLTALAVIYGYFAETRNLWKAALVIAAIPIAVIANGLRIMGTGLVVQYWDPQKGEGFFHTFSGWIIFVLSLAMLFVLHWTFKILRTSSVRVKEAN